MSKNKEEDRICDECNKPKFQAKDTRDLYNVANCCCSCESVDLASISIPLDMTSIL